MSIVALRLRRILSSWLVNGKSISSIPSREVRHRDGMMLGLLSLPRNSICTGPHHSHVPSTVIVSIYD